MAAYHYQQGDRPLDGYTIRYALGRGGFGEVYFAVSDAGREVALKAVQNFEEIELRGIGHCMNLKSPHLVMIFDIKHATDGMPWVIMEYVSGPSLREVLDESPDGLGIDQAKFFLRELAKGLSYLHEAGVVHRDLKPHNVFFEDGIVKIGDYSLSKVITASHRSGNTMTVGRVHYMAPEISLGRYDRTVDIYALGIMLYEMLAGQPPYVGESMGEVLMKHLSSDPDVSQLPEPFAGVIVKAMQRDPANRFQTAQEMVEAVKGAAPPKPLYDSFNPTTLTPVFDNRPTFRWTEPAGAASYQFYLRAPNGSVVNLSGLTEGSYTPGEDLQEGRYSWWVRPFTDDGRAGFWSERGETWIGGRPTVLTPIATTTDAAPTFTWTSVEGAESYEVFLNRTDVAEHILRTPDIPAATFDHQFWTRASMYCGCEQKTHPETMDCGVRRASSV